MVRTIKDKAEFDQALQDAGIKLVVVDFTATWCGPCRKIGPYFTKLSEMPEFQDVIFLKVDVDDAQEVATSCEVRCMPTFQYYKNRAKVHEFSGADEQQLLANLEKFK
ncbi:thioredoxin-like [Brienomyrus brachyistius]|uniref:thioredoxin-like n=1 Tax=Brienomyrus brachyistius TaxID=42636 RepID=UPI0020B1DD6B|nr:thioredoxin-like [Brienomyrus brachyistius]